MADQNELIGNSDELPDVAIAAIAAALDLVRWDQEQGRPLNSDAPISRFSAEA